MTLIELAVAASVMSLVAVVMGGLAAAVGTAREHIEGMQEASARGRFAIDRMRHAVDRSGTYRIGSGATIPGVAVVWNSDRPEILVVWTGGRETSLANGSPLARLPKANELAIYAPDPAAPQRLLEIVVPTATGDVDFAGSGFATRIRQIVSAASQADKVAICDRVRVATVGGVAAGAVRFEWESAPTDDQLAATSPGTVAWRGLPWANGISTSASGFRQVCVRIELQVVTIGAVGQASDAPALPVFGAAVRRFEHRKG